MSYAVHLLLPDVRVRHSSHGLKRTQQHQLNFLEWELKFVE